MHYRQLSHVYWMGGSPCSGKTSIAQALAGEFGLHYYSCDDAFYRHAKIITAEAQPAFYRAMRFTSEELWMRPVEALVEDEITIYHEQFPLILADLLALPSDTPVLAEGAALLPELIAPLLDAPERGIWIVPTAAFQQHHYAQREWAKDVVKDCSDPARAFQNWMERDMRFAQQVGQQADDFGLRLFVVDGSRSIADTITLVKNHFRI